MNMPRDFSDINRLHNLWQNAVMESNLFDIHIQRLEVVYENK